jgi:hypothetical protein
MQSHRLKRHLPDNANPFGDKLSPGKPEGNFMAPYKQ